MNVLYFTAEWCGPCKAFKPIVNQVVLQTGINIQYVDVDASRDLAANYQIASVPTILILKDGQVAARKSGAMSAEDLKRFFSQHR